MVRAHLDQPCEQPQHCVPNEQAEALLRSGTPTGAQGGLRAQTLSAEGICLRSKKTPRVDILVVFLRSKKKPLTKKNSLTV